MIWSMPRSVMTSPHRKRALVLLCWLERGRFPGALIGQSSKLAPLRRYLPAKPRAWKGEAASASVHLFVAHAVSNRQSYKLTKLICINLVELRC